MPLETKTQCSSDCSNCLSTFASHAECPSLFSFHPAPHLSRIMSQRSYDIIHHEASTFLLLREDRIQIRRPWRSEHQAVIASHRVSHCKYPCRACDSMQGKARSNSKGCKQATKVVIKILSLGCMSKIESSPRKLCRFEACSQEECNRIKQKTVWMLFSNLQQKPRSNNLLAKLCAR